MFTHFRIISQANSIRANMRNCEMKKKFLITNNVEFFSLTPTKTKRSQLLLQLRNLENLTIKLEKFELTIKNAEAHTVSGKLSNKNISEQNQPENRESSKMLIPINIKSIQFLLLMM